MPDKNGKLTKADMYKKSVLDKLSDKEINENLIRLKLIDPKAQGFKMGGMAKKKTKYMAKGGMKKTKYMAKGGVAKKTKMYSRGGAAKRK
jgi:hypothetical protein